MGRGRRKKNLRRAAGKHCREEWEALKSLCDYRCVACNSKEEDDMILLTKDHVVPLSKGGSNWIQNIQPLCEFCNQEKADEIIDYRPEFIRNRIKILSAQIMWRRIFPQDPQPEILF